MKLSSGNLKCANTAFPGNPLLSLTITYKQHSLSFDGHGFEFGGKGGGGRQHFIIKEFAQKNPFFYNVGCTWSSEMKNKYVCLQHSSRRTMEEKISCFAEKPRSICGILVYNAYYVYYAYNACIIGNRVEVPFFIRIGQRLDHFIGITQKSYCIIGSVFFLLLFGFL